MACYLANMSQVIMLHTPEPPAYAKLCKPAMETFSR